MSLLGRFDLRLHINGVGLVMGGAVTHLERFIPALLDVRPDWDVVVYISPPGPTFLVPGVRTEVVNRASWRRLIWDSVSVARRARSAGADVLLNLANYGPVRSGIPSLLYQRNALYFDPAWVERMAGAARLRARLRRKLAFAQMQHATAVVVPSEAMAGYLRSWSGCPLSTPIEVVPHGIDLDRFEFAPRRRSGSVHIVALGDAYPHKDHGLLVEMMSELRRRDIEASLQLTACDEDAPRHVAALRERIRATGLGDRIRLVGKVDAASFLASADVMVMPSVTESFGFPVLEAMASGVPVVASSIPSTMELLGDLGWYFPVGNAVAAADGIVSMLEADAAEIRLRLTAAREVAGRYTWQANALRVTHLIESAAAVA